MGKRFCKWTLLDVKQMFFGKRGAGVSEMIFRRGVVHGAGHRNAGRYEVQ